MISPIMIHRQHQTAASRLTIRYLRTTGEECHHKLDCGFIDRSCARCTGWPALRVSGFPPSSPGALSSAHFAIPAFALTP
jgi:hypothetical protein